MNLKPTEATLEARMHAVLADTFPWMSPESLQHQTHFTVRLGHTTPTIDGSRISGRSDILILLNNKPIALLELKREDISLTDDDVAQGLSYARLTTPSMPPLVIVSNGIDTRIFITYSGEEWNPIERTEVELQQRIKNVGKLAATDLNNAVEVFMGADQQHWIAALQSASQQLIEERTGTWSDTTPFVRDFIFPRKATAEILWSLNKNSRVIVLHGAPLSGKSNVLRALVEYAEISSEPFAVLLIEPTGIGIFNAISNLLSHELSWSVSSNDAREWLRSISVGNKAKLILALDGVDPSFAADLADLNELASSRFSESLQMVIAVDDSSLDTITKKANGRENNALGRTAHHVPLLRLDDDEFKHAQQTMGKHRILVTSGGESVLSLREPWILRALIPADVTELPIDMPSLCVKLPPLMDIEALSHTQESIDLKDDTCAALRLAASAILDQYLESDNVEEILHGISTFAVDLVRLEKEIGDTSIRLLRQDGLIKPGINWAEQPVWFIRVPALVANHIAAVLFERMRSWEESANVIAKRLISLSAKLPLGDIIVASALVKFITRVNINPLDILEELLNLSPKTLPLPVGSEFSVAISNGILHGKVTSSGNLLLSDGTTTQEIPLEKNDLTEALVDNGGWLILSHIAGLPLGISSSNESGVSRLDEPLLTELAQAKVILSRVDGGQDFKSIAVHDIPDHGSIVCHESGIVEPITWSMVKFFINSGPDATQWIEDSLNMQSLPMLTRIYIALREVSGLSDARGKWANEMLSKHIGPAISTSLMRH